MNRPVMAANWKMNNGPTSAREFMTSFLDQYPRQNDRTVVIFPPALSVATVAAAIADRRDIIIGIQNVHWQDQGAFTGELSVAMARDAGARVVLVGHSERRHVVGETDDETALKCAAVERGGLTPLLCVGEKLDQREAGRAEERTDLDGNRVEFRGEGNIVPKRPVVDFHASLERMLPGVAGRIVFLTGGAYTPRAKAFLDQVANQRFDKPFEEAELRLFVRDRIG